MGNRKAAAQWTSIEFDGLLKLVENTGNPFEQDDFLGEKKFGVKNSFAQYRREIEPVVNAAVKALAKFERDDFEELLIGGWQGSEVVQGLSLIHI